MSTRLAPSPKNTGTVEITDELRRRIRSGQWKAGDKLPSYSESKVLFGTHSVALEKAHAQLEREGLIRRERGRGTFVTQSTPRGRKVSTGLIGVAGKGFSFKEYSPYWVNLLKGIRGACDEGEKQIVLLDFESNRGWEQADGVLICDWSNDITLKFLPPGMPCVSLLVPVAGLVSVYADDYSGGRMATEYLLKLGHRRIAHLHSRDPFVSARRLAGHRDALESAGIKPNPLWEKVLRGKVRELDFGARFVDKGRDIMNQWLQADWKKLGCTAVVAQNDETAWGVIQALRAAKIRVPEDVSIIGFDGAAGENSMHSIATQQITTLEVPLEEIGKTAAQLLLRQLAGEEVGSAHQVFPTRLIEGQSVAGLE